VKVRGDVDAFVRAATARGLEPRRVAATAELRLPRPAMGEEAIFAAAVDSGTQIRYLGPSVSTMEELFLSLVERPRAGAAA
jgi:hypothetical protein